MARPPKKKSRTHSRHLWKEKHRRQYTFTKTKFAVGFTISVLFSVFLGSYFDRFGQVVLRQSWDAFREAMQGQPTLAVTAGPSTAQASVDSTPAEIVDVETRVKNLKLTSVQEKLRGTRLEASTLPSQEAKVEPDSNTTNTSPLP